MADAGPITEYVLTEHARFEMARRQISIRDIDLVLRVPEQAEFVSASRMVYQSRLELFGSGKMYLLRVFVDLEPEVPEVVTVYATSKIKKYWRFQR